MSIPRSITPASAPSDAGFVDEAGATDLNRGVGVILERMRKRLLDLSASNRLLNYKHPRGKSLRVIDELPAQIHTRLLEGKQMYFVPLAIPTEKHGQSTFTRSQREVSEDSASDSTYARRVARDVGREARARTFAAASGIDPGYELPNVGTAPRHADGMIQTLRDPEELEELLRKIEREAKTYIQEQGANRLHLMFGFVEWREPLVDPDDEKGKRFAPLVLLPVQLTRGAIDPKTRTYRYEVSATGEDWDVNVTLQEKCRAEFDLELPDVGEDEDLEVYFARVQRALQHAPRGWEFRRMVTLGLVSFGKILMWRDLDPDHWPADKPFFKHAPIGEILGGTPIALSEDGNESGALADEYPIDNLPPDLGVLPPIIVDADSSQHSALIDAVRGDNLVVQGPPGTGKSQTITNLIAAALWEGKKVLFVAEKRAALDVVRRRIEEAGLGPFVLALHSHTAQKRELVDSLKTRIDLARKGTGDEDAGASQRLDAARNRLNRHVERLHGTFGALKVSPYRILWHARRLLDGLTPEALAVLGRVHIPSARTVSAATLDETRIALDEFASAYGAMSADNPDLARHPWAGITRDDLSSEAMEHLVDATIELRAAIESCLETTQTIEIEIGAAGPTTLTESALFRAATDALHDLALNVPADLPFRVLSTENLPLYHAAITAVGEARAAWTHVLAKWNADLTIDHEWLEAADHTIDDAVYRFGHWRSLGDLSVLSDTLDELTQDAAACVAISMCARETFLPDLPSPTTVISGALSIAARSMTPVDAAALALRSSALTEPDAARELTALAEAANDLRSQGEALDTRFNPIQRPGNDVLRAAITALSTAWPGVLAYLRGDYRSAVRTHRMLTGGAKRSRAEMLTEIRAVLSHDQAVATFGRRADLIRLLGEDARGLDSPFDAAQRLVVWRADIETAVRGAGPDGRMLLDACWTAEARNILEFAARARHTGVVDGAARLSNRGPHLKWALPAEWNNAHGVSIGDIQILIQETHAVAKLALTIGISCGAPMDVSLQEVQEHLAAVRRALDADKTVSGYAEAFHTLDIDARGPATDVSTLQGALEYLEHLEHCGFSPEITRWIAGPDASARVNRIRTYGSAIGVAQERLENTVTAFRVAGGVDEAAWLAVIGGVAGPSEIAHTPFPQLLARIHHALEKERMLFAWAAYRQRRTRAGMGLGRARDVIDLVERGDLAAGDAADAYEAVLYRTLAAAVFSEVPELDRFSGLEQEQVQQRFRIGDVGEVKRMQQQIADRLCAAKRFPGIAYGVPVGALTDEGLIEHEAKKKKRLIAIRELFKRAGNAIQSLKPCFMMGPQAVAQFLHVGKFEFDLVVMDEASQMRPEDALGAIARGKQVVIVGDPMQLGPSAFFDKQSDDDDDDDDYSPEEEADASARPAGKSVLERSESILTAAAQRYPTRMLRWHYRSRHPKLIAFSNREFYDGRLIVFPTPSQEEVGDGVVLYRVEAPVYGDQRNIREAQAVVAAVRAHASRCPERTLMVATMNIHQADLIDGLLGQAEKDDPVLADFRRRHAETPEPFEVKNLENVQGDERDVVMVSVTFGPDADGKLSQNFGAINRRGGERRLNVLFTRAKHRTEVFCSFEPTSLRVNGASVGLRVLRDYLVYASDAKWAMGSETDRAPDSDFEISVSEALTARGWTVRSQVGVVGYFIDLAIVHPEFPGRFLLGVECDGAAYHSAKSARDRDRLRQNVLEGLGWKIHRVWSTDWFRDPVGQANRVTAVAHAQLDRENGTATDLAVDHPPDPHEDFSRI